MERRKAYTALSAAVMKNYFAVNQKPPSYTSSYEKRAAFGLVVREASVVFNQAFMDLRPFLDEADNAWLSEMYSEGGDLVQHTLIVAQTCECDPITRPAEKLREIQGDYFGRLMDGAYFRLFKGFYPTPQPVRSSTPTEPPKLSPPGTEPPKP